MNELRFRKPVPIDQWDDVFFATNLPNSCSQENYGEFPGFKRGFSEENIAYPNTPTSEDCLYLNLWVPTKLRRHNNNDISNATVMIWIHGGGNTAESSSLEHYNGLTLAAMNDVIVASMNYRLGALGFLYLGTEEAPGNMGLYDQALAIQWIKDNIHLFGGNPNSITLFGSSSGAGSITAHLLSPVSSHLVKRAILQAGVINAVWGHRSAESVMKLSLDLAKDVGCFNEYSSPGITTHLNGTEATAIINCLRGMEAEQITKVQENGVSSLAHDIPMIWEPIVNATKRLFFN